MLSDKITLVEGGSIANLTVPSGTVFPGNANIGELFYRTDAPAGLYYYTGAAWVYLTEDTSFDPTNIGSNVLPATTSTFDLGSTTKRWRSIYVDDMFLSGNTLYLGDTPVMGTNATTIEIKADPNQSILMQTSGTGSTTVQSASQVAISSTGTSGISVTASGTGADIAFTATDDIQMSANTITLTPTTTATVNGGLTVTGTATFSGASFLVDNLNFRTSDNILYINYGETGSGVTVGSGLAGIQVDRGDLTDFQFVFDETDDTFKAGLVGSLQSLATQGYVTTTVSTHAGDATLHLTSAQNTLLDGLSGTLTATELNYVDGVTSSIQTQIGNRVLKSGDSMSGQLDMGTNRIINVGSPTAGTDGATKNYVDSLISGLTWKSAVAAATTASITLSGTQTVDSYALSVGERVLVKNQSTPSQNGIYVVASGAWTRSTDADSAAELDHASVFVEHGAQEGTGWTVGTGPTVLGTDPVIWTQFNGAANTVAGVGLSKTGNQMDINLGAGITENPSDQIGIDLYTGGGLMLTEDGTNSSTAAAAQLSLTKTGISNGTYTKVTVDVYGRITAAESPTTLAGYGITDAASSVHGHTFASVTSKPTTLSGYGITDAATSSHTHTFDSLTSKPTTLAGYGITDGALNTHNHDTAYVNVGGDTMSGALTVNGALTGTAIINGSKNSQTSYGTAGLQSTSTTGNAGIGLHCSGNTAAYIDHVRGGQGIRVFDAGGNFAGVQCSRLDAAVTQTTGSGNTAHYITSGSYTVQFGIDTNGNPYIYTAHNTTIRLATNNGDKVYVNSSGLYPAVDNQIACGIGGNRWTAVYAVYGAISTSDKREKNHIENVENVGSIIDSIQPVRFSWKSNGQQDVGFYAQDVQPYVPEAVEEGNEETPWGMKQERMIALLWAEVKELRGRMEQLEKLENIQ